MGSWGYGQSLLKRATNLGLIERKVKKDKSRGRGKPRIYNSLTNKGREVVGLADKVGYSKVIFWKNLLFIKRLLVFEQTLAKVEKNF